MGKKRFISLTLIVVLVLSLLAGCGKKESPTGGKEG